jgi:glyceraldehyde 3-phosphate dehydrogenase
LSNIKRRARHSRGSLAETTTGSASAIAPTSPGLQGKLNIHAVRAPGPDASLTDCVFELKRETTPAEVNALFAQAVQGPLVAILGCQERPLVSADFAGDIRSAIVDAPSPTGAVGMSVAWVVIAQGICAVAKDLAPPRQPVGHPAHGRRSFRAALQVGGLLHRQPVMDETTAHR